MSSKSSKNASVLIGEKFLISDQAFLTIQKLKPKAGKYNSTINQSYSKVVAPKKINFQKLKSEVHLLKKFSDK